MQILVYKNPITKKSVLVPKNYLNIAKTEYVLITAAESTIEPVKRATDSKASGVPTNFARGKNTVKLSTFFF